MTRSKTRLNGLSGYGLWDLEGIAIQVFSDSRATIRYQQRVVNAYQHEISVRINTVDKWRSTTLEQKLKSKIHTLREELSKRNVEIIRLREIGERALGEVSGKKADVTTDEELIIPLDAIRRVLPRGCPGCGS